MNPARRRALAAVLAAALGLPVAAQESPGGFAGQWTISGVTEGPEICVITLGDEPAIGGWTVDIPDQCVERFDLPRDVAAWTLHPDGAINFLDPTRKVLLTFEPMLIEGYVAELASGDLVSIDRTTPDDREPTEQERMSGRMRLTAPGGVALCGWESKANETGMAGTLVRSEPCAGIWGQAVGWVRGDLDLRLLDEHGRTLDILKGESLLGFYSPPDREPSLAFGRAVN